MTVDMLAAEYQAPGELGEELGSGGVVDQDVSMMVPESLDDITFDTDDGLIDHLQHTEDASGDAADALPGSLDQVAANKPSSPVDASPYPEDVTGADPADAEDVDSSEKDVVVEPVAPPAAAIEVDAAEIVGDHNSHPNPKASGSHIATQHSAPDADELEAEIDYEGNDDILTEAALASKSGPEPREVGDGQGHPDGEIHDLAGSSDLHHTASDLNSTRDPAHTIPPNEDTNHSDGHGEDGDEYDLDANDHGDYADLGREDSDPDAEDILPDDHADLSVQDHDQGLSVSDAEHEEGRDGEEDVEYMEVAEVEKASDEFSTRPLIRVRYRDTTYSLFSVSKADDPYSYFFSDLEALEHPLSQFLAGLREVLSDELTPEEELVIRIEGLGLEFSETMDKSSLDRVTFGAIVDLHDRLVKADDPDSRDVTLLVYLVTRPNTMRRLDSLLDGANIGEGLSAYHMTYPDYLLVDFPSREPAKGSTTDISPRTDLETYDAGVASDLEAEDDSSPDETQGASQDLPQDTNARSDWHESGDEAGHDEDLLGDSYDQVIDGAHEQTSVYSKHSVSRQSSPGDLEGHDNGSEAVRELEVEESIGEGAQSEAQDTHSPQGSDRPDVSLNADAGFDEAGAEVEAVYEAHEDHTESNSQDLDQIQGLIAQELESSGQDEVEGDVAAGHHSTTSDGGHDLGSWDDRDRDGDSAAAAGDESLGSSIQDQFSGVDDVESHIPQETGDEDWGLGNAQTEPEAAILEDQSFEILRRHSAADMTNAASPEHSSASATLDGDEIDLEELLAAPTGAGGQPNDDIAGTAHEEQAEVDEIDWDDNENEAAILDSITSTPSSNPGKRARELDDGEGTGDGHDVKRHRS